MPAYFVEQAASAFDVPQTHEERTVRIGLTLLPAYPHYRRLENLSRKARYEPGYTAPAPDAVQKLENADFHPIAVELRKRGIALHP